MSNKVYSNTQLELKQLHSTSISTSWNRYAPVNLGRFEQALRLNCWHWTIRITSRQWWILTVLPACFGILTKTTKLVICQRYWILKNWHSVPLEGSWQCLRLNHRRQLTQIHSSGRRNMNTYSSHHHDWLKKYLAIPAMSAPNERVFALAGNTCNRRIASLSLQNLDALVFSKCQSPPNGHPHRCLTLWLTGKTGLP